MDNYFDQIDLYQQSNIIKEEKKIKCCDNIENYMCCEENTICRICNQEINILSSNPEKCYEGSKQTSRVGMPINELLPDSSTGSVIQNKYTSCNTSMRTISRLNMYQGIPYKTRSLLLVFNTISENCNRHNISKKIINEAQGLYRIVSQYKISRGNNRTGIISAVIFISCKNCGCPRSAQEISKIMNTEKKIVTKGIKQLQDIIRINKIPLQRVSQERVTAIDLIDRVCNNIYNLNNEQINEIKLMCNHFSETYSKDLSSCTPSSLSAAIINFYVITNNIELDKSIISEHSSVSVVTIQKITNILISIVES